MFENFWFGSTAQQWAQDFNKSKELIPTTSRVMLHESFTCTVIFFSVSELNGVLGVEPLLAI